MRRSFLSVVTCLSNVGPFASDEVSSRELSRVDRAINANVADNYDQLDGEDVEGQFGVVGYGDEVGARGGRGGFGRGMQRGGGRGGRGFGQQQHPGRGGPAMFNQHMLPPGAPNPQWLQNSNPFGISAPIEGMIQLPLKPQDAAGLGAFTATVTSIAYLGRTQRPFRGERVVATVTRIGTTAASPSLRTANGIVVGVVPQQAQLGTTNVAEWSNNSFGVRMAMNVAYPGNDITSTVNLVGTLTAPDQILLDLTIYGRYVG